MKLCIEPTSELSIKVDNKRIGKLSALTIDLNKSPGLFSMPKIKLLIEIYAKSFEGNEKKLQELKNLAGSCAKFLDVVIYE